MADTRKDKRAPVSLKVRFKSADISEFIEQYSVDISNGGMFIQSKNPLDVGTLLKFELQLKDESRIIEGVGRVVWIRADGESTSAKLPAGMGVKFIKMSPESRVVVERIVSTRGERPSSFESIPSGAIESDAPASTPNPISGTSSMRTTVPALPDQVDGPPKTYSSTPPMDDDSEVEHTQVRHASEFLALALAEGASDKATLAEAELRANEARLRTEHIEEQRALASAFGSSRREDETERSGRPPLSAHFDEHATTSFHPKEAAEPEARKPRPVLEVLRETSVPPPPGPGDLTGSGPINVKVPLSLGVLRTKERDPYYTGVLDARLVRMIMFAVLLVGGLVLTIQCTQHKIVKPQPDSTEEMAP